MAALFSVFVILGGLAAAVPVTALATSAIGQTYLGPSSLVSQRDEAEAQYQLGLMYANGDGVVQDEAAARERYTRAAEQGHANAQYRLAVMFDTGTGGPKDDRAAREWYLAAARQ
ncbi:MAG: tetratricopeptide repeat protein, partial [Kiloniellales bacterium]|nr:tetratricopeptide repeat protein [Kiloniellales bacterium]